MVLRKIILLGCSFYLRPFQWEWFVSANQLECKQALGFAHSNFEAQTYNHKKSSGISKKMSLKRESQFRDTWSRIFDTVNSISRLY